MTRGEIMAMKPGQELDALVAEKIMRLDVVRCLATNKPIGLYVDTSEWSSVDEPIPFYSTDIAVAWQVIERMLEVDREVFELEYDKCEFDLMRWHALFYGRMTGVASGDTAPEAICKAALLAVNEEERYKKGEIGQ